MTKQTVVVALGGNALLRRGEPLEAEVQRQNIEIAVKTISQIAQEYNVVLVHGNGPQVGLLALQGLEYKKVSPYPLDVLGSETQGMIGYMLMQEFKNQMPNINATCMLTQMTVDPNDPAFADPTKPIGPIYEEAEARELAEKYRWTIKPDGQHFRRVVPSPQPTGIIEHEAITKLIDEGHLVICTGGGGIPVKRENGKLVGVEAVIDKDMSAAFLAKQLDADALLILTDADAVYLDWGKPTQHALRSTNPSELAKYQFDAGSMGPKIEASCEFIKQGGKVVGIGSLEDGLRILQGTAGTNITKG
ncbi:carbamate kinase [Vibrio brasiliensis]|jgi:carbamate kinase|uniref:Carbamate kinase n=1 Tax=Vibrio brasiliensis LMG 20546 TaxID=945543 RepID=E8LRB0_9VIBR|nr:carbamate kinase [Vibrio brasiliensis]EGA66753.1 carbamate kinase [Vibrio brasiliensis LMG 20546]MCG9650520.1 carbamate kinase [Vibrio brasiliensis]MCG9723848.1 carbamate kinase [Vibrio brasiliensis]MCG9750380.1 carbamate kinase [Vibrio brasiliensis]MCG9783427.1 carbamate kinase [Vibrio brasiliensis]|tara:strand:- start:1115 stop:2026 length:912 start_codon:yes stop_codon:yes gene_type:complete